MWDGGSSCASRNQHPETSIRYPTSRIGYLYKHNGKYFLDAPLPQQHDVGIVIVEQEQRLVGIVVIKLDPRAESLVEIGGAQPLG